MSQYIQMSCAFLLALLVALNLVKIWHILTLSFIVGLGQAFGGPAYSALLPTLVDAEDLTNAVALNSIQFNLARIIGPTIGGFAYAVFGRTWCFVLNGVSFIAVIVSLYMIHVKFVPPKSSVSILSSMKEGISFIREREGLRPLVVLAFLFSLRTYLPEGRRLWRS
jgi:MFS family permease